MQVAASYAAEQLALLLNGGGAPAWFAPTTVATLISGSETSIFHGDAAGYLSAASAAIGGGNVAISSMQTATGEANSVVVAVAGKIAEDSCTRGFSLTSTLGESDEASTFYTVSETLVLFDPIATAQPEPAAAPVEEPAAAPAAAAPVEEPAQPEEEVAAATAQAPEAPAEREETPTPPSPPASPAVQPPKAKEEQPAKPAAPAGPKPKGWAAIAAANKDQPIAPIKQVVPPKPTTPQPEPVKEAPKPAAPKRKPVLSQVTFKVTTPVTDDDIRAALPASLQEAVVLLRNKTSEPTTQRVFIDFSVADAVSAINAAKMVLAGKTVVAQEPHKKPLPQK